MPRLFYDVSDPARLRAALESLDTFVDDRDRRRWLPNGAFVYTTIAYSSIAVTGTHYGPSLPDAASTAATATLAVPSTWINGTISVTSYIGNNAAAAGNLVLTMRASTIAPGVAGASTLIYSATTAAPAQNQVIAVSSTASHAVTGNDDLIFINVSRLGADGADTLAGTAVLFGALVTYNPA